MSKRIETKTSEEIETMIEGGKRLSNIKDKLKRRIKAGINAFEIEKLAEELIVKAGGKSSFKMVPGYHWATCVNVNDGVVHGIPKKEIVFKKGDVVSVDVGMYYKGFHTDTSFTVAIDADPEVKKFLRTGQRALKLAISKALPGGRIYDLSFAIESTLKSEGYSPVRALVGHGIGKNLHEEPQIPCFVGDIKRNDTPEIPEAAALAIEVIYAKGSGDVKLSGDGWTILSSDGKITALFEDTILVTKSDPLVLTDLSSVSSNSKLNFKESDLGLT